MHSRAAGTGAYNRQTSRGALVNNHSPRFKPAGQHQTTRVREEERKKLRLNESAESYSGDISSRCLKWSCADDGHRPWRLFLLPLSAIRRLEGIHTLLCGEPAGEER